MREKIFSVFFALLGLLGSIWMIWMDSVHGNFCPPVFHIPVCYVSAVIFFIAFFLSIQGSISLLPVKLFLSAIGMTLFCWLYFHGGSAFSGYPSNAVKFILPGLGEMNLYLIGALLFGLELFTDFRQREKLPEFDIFGEYDDTK